MPRKAEVAFIRGKGKTKGKIVVKNARGEIVVDIPVKQSFDPGTIDMDAHCCNGDMQDCVLRKAGENCADTTRPITVWYFTS